MAHELLDVILSADPFQVGNLTAFVVRSGRVGGSPRPFSIGSTRKGVVVAVSGAVYLGLDAVV